MTRRIAFYAPLKPPDHPIPSGDREIARLTMTALERAGYDVALASRFISYQKRPSEPDFEARRIDGTAEAARLIEGWQAAPDAERPDLWLTYHPYCKAPDWLGPAASRALVIPYLTVEACRTRQNTDADWARGRAVVQAAIRHAAINFCLKPSDRAYLQDVLPSMESVVPLAPFMDLGALPPLPQKKMSPDGPLIVTAGMMRPGKKERCFLMLADALKQIAGEPWRLVVIGDGPARPLIERAFSGFEASRIEWTGAIDHGDVIGWLDRADLFAWPGYREPIGMVYLEAAARGLPVAAFDSLGVPLVVRHGETGLLVPEGDIAAYAEALRRLLRDPELRSCLGRAGLTKVRAEHDLSTASTTMRMAIEQLFTEPVARR
ncbi:MAG TPA: glycosyltransferase family 4 protein [Pararhizobium sp.]|nr:glycosyltransferase family 4 protein [Pararhizobium sp.]